MRKTIVAIFAFLLLFSGVVQAETFSLISSSFEYGLFPYGSSSAGMQLKDGKSVISVEAWALGLEGVSGGYSSASATVVFRPEFTGLGPAMYFDPYVNSGGCDATYAGVEIRDINTNTDLLSMVLYDGYERGYGPIDNPYWYSAFVGPINAAQEEVALIHPEWFDNSLRYNAWDPTHLYELSLTAIASAPDDWGGVGAGITTSITFSNVPEPTTMLLLGLGLMGLAGVRRKIKK